MVAMASKDISGPLKGSKRGFFVTFLCQQHLLTPRNLVAGLAASIVTLIRPYEEKLKTSSTKAAVHE